jgi:hypothetical protein
MSQPKAVKQGTIASPSGQERKEDVKQEGLSDWVKQIYDVNLLPDDQLQGLYDVVRYHGFDRQEVLRQLQAKVQDPKKVAWVVILIALRGPQAAVKTKMPDGTVLSQMGIPASGGQGTLVLTCNRIQAATADLAAFYLKRLNVPKRLNVSLPGWLQFPAAGSIKLPENLRVQHAEFQRQFSVLIGGAFNESIYAQMQANAYLDPALHLFD